MKLSTALVSILFICLALRLAGPVGSLAIATATLGVHAIDTAEANRRRLERSRRDRLANVKNYFNKGEMSISTHSHSDGYGYY